MGVDLAEDAQLDVVDRERQERFVVHLDEGAVGSSVDTCVGHRRSVVGIDQRAHAVGHDTALGDLGDDPTTDLHEALLRPRPQHDGGCEGGHRPSGRRPGLVLVAVLRIG